MTQIGRISKNIVTTLIRKNDLRFCYITYQYHRHISDALAVSVRDYSGNRKRRRWGGGAGTGVKSHREIVR